MDTEKLMQMFIEQYISPDRKDRWMDLSSKKHGVFKNLNQLERHLGQNCSRVSEMAFLEKLFESDKTLWIWDFYAKSVSEVTGLPDIKNYSNSAFVAISEKSGTAFYFNGDADYWICKK